MSSYRLTLAYDGTLFAGSQVQPQQRTVQGELQGALRALTGKDVGATLAGRTDRGVHAVGQIAAMRLCEWRGTPEELARALRTRLPEDLAVTAVERCDDSFNPRFDARWREYRYWVSPGQASPFLGRYAWLPRTGLDAAAIAKAADGLLGTHDFASFASGGEGVPWSERALKRRGTTRSVFRCECRQFQLACSPGIAETRLVHEFRVIADGFLPRMVRNMVGALVEVGRGRGDPEWVAEMVASPDRRSGSMVVAPPQGLTFWRVGFGAETWDEW